MCPSYARKPAMYDAKCEVYSFGVVLMELITGKLQAQMDFYEVRGGGGRRKGGRGRGERERDVGVGREATPTSCGERVVGGLDGRDWLSRRATHTRASSVACVTKT